MGDLLLSALRLRPDRIIVGEARGGEAFSLLQAMNTGHSGSLTTVHANSPLDALRRLETLCLMSGVELPLRAVRAQVASAIQLVVICGRFPDGSRRLTHIAEVLPLDEHGDYRTRDLFVFELSGRDLATGTVLGAHRATGAVPDFAPRFRAYGFTDMDAAFFAPATLEETPVEPVRILTEETPRDMPAPPSVPHAPPPEPDIDEAEIARQVAEAAVAHDHRDEPRPPPPSAEPVRVIRDEPSIQLAPDLAEEIEKRLPEESTLITKHRGGAHDEDRDKTQPGAHSPRRR
jgi:pilus assembly protein CpaF